jgi:3D (Asp-Asp-Asp) domain-containing protein
MNIQPLKKTVVGLALSLSIAGFTLPAHAAQAASNNTVQTVSGKSMTYSKVMNIVATAYSEAPQENGWGPIDYFGNPLKIGTIAVDPNVIPLGTKVYITGYTFNGFPKGLIATATDEGSAIKGNRVDIFIPSSTGPASDFGIQNVKVYVLK